MRRLGTFTTSICNTMPMTIFISPHLKGSGIRIQTSPLIIKFDLFKTQINNFVIHKYLEETDQTAKSCKRNVRIKTYLFSIDTVFRGYFPIRTFITFPFDLSFPFIYFFCVCWARLLNRMHFLLNLL